MIRLRKTGVLLVAFGVVGALAWLPMGSAAKEGWRELKSSHFILYYQGAEPSFPERVRQEAEAHYEALAKSLGFSRRS